MKDKLKKAVNSDVFNYIFNALIVILIFIAVLMIKDVSPFGSKILGKSDALAQYKPMLYDYIMGLKTGTLEIYSFNNALGNSFLFNFVYYLISPFNLIALLFKDADIMFLSVILIKMAVASVTMTFYAKKNGASNFIATIAAISYVFCGWFLAYWYNIMWLDTFALFPLFQYSLDKLLKENKCLLYIFVLAFVYVTNFHQAFSILVYNIVYFIVYNFFYKRDKIVEKLKTLLLFLVSTLIAVVLIYVYIYTLVLVKRQMGLGFSDVSEAGYVVSTIDFIKTIFYGVVRLTTDTSGGNTFPNVCISTVALIGLISFFFNKKISIRDRLFAFIGLDLLVFCVFYKQFDYVMHMFHNVVGLTFRYSYIMSFLMIVLFIKNANNFELNKKKSFIILIILFVLLGLCYKSIEFEILVLNIIFLLSIGVLIYFYDNNNLYKFIVFSFVIVQSIIIGTYNFSSELELTQEGNKNNYSQDSYEYRVKSVTDKDFLNQNLYYNQNVLYDFTSMTYNKVLNMVSNLGCLSGQNVMTCNINDKLTNMIFNVKDNFYLERIYSVNKKIKEVSFDEGNVKSSYEQLIAAMTGIENIYDKEVLIGRVSDDNIIFTTDEKYYLIDYLEDGIDKNRSQWSHEFYYSEESGVTEVNIYTINENKLAEIYDNLNKNQINYSYYSDSLMEGEIEVGEEQLIFTSIPYDEVWHVYIDDEEVEPIKLLEDSLLAIDCGEGKHKIKLEYKIDFKKPLMISISVFIILVAYSVLKVLRFHIIRNKH